ncbi:hypothetical protein [Sphingomonas carotinifaciens]|uniref:hypothetical protein n=1 Tax=Sphingomonas carotinifaciens TaxID=1166323 RepID=UPI00135849D7|nr:hypothetical protein [Sphingomonas carotinifaciens]MBB4087509.1 hypothetical protein [Sphingomonas carotinifaciens]
MESIDHRHVFMKRDGPRLVGGHQVGKAEEGLTAMIAAALQDDAELSQQAG